MQVALGFYQVLLSLGHTFDLSPLPADYLMVVSYFTFLDFDWSGLAYPVGCLSNGYHVRLLAISIAPFVIITGILLVVWGRRCTRCNGVLAHRFVQFDHPDEQERKERRRGSHVIELSTAREQNMIQSSGREAEAIHEPPKTLKKEQTMAFYVVLIVIFTFLPNVSRAIFSVWVCVWYEDVPGAAPVGFLRKDVSIQCGTNEHDALQALAFALVLLWPVGMVGVFIGILFHNRKQLRAGEAHSTSAKAARFLTSGFKDKYFYWELVELMRRLLVSGWVTLIPYDKMFFRSTFVLLISFMLVVLTALAHPWSQPEDNMLALVSQVCRPPFSFTCSRDLMTL